MAHLRAAVDMRGLNQIDYARRLLEQAPDADDHWAVARSRAAHYDLHRGSMSVDEAFAKLDAYRGKTERR